MPTPDLVVPPGLCQTRPPEKVTRDAAERDVQLLRHVLDRAYAGMEVLASRGVKWDTIFERARRAIRAWPGDLYPEVLQTLLLAALQGVPDGHLALYTIGDKGRWRYGTPAKHRDAWTAGVRFEGRGGGFYSVHTPLLAAGHELVSCQGVDKIGALLRPTLDGQGRSRWLPIVLSAEATPAPLVCTVRPGDGGETRQLRLTLHRLKPPAKKVPRDKRPPILQVRGGKVPWVRLGAFDSRQAQLMSQFEASAALVRAARLAVVDMRGNPGGDDTHASNWFRALTNQVFQYTTINEVVSEVTLAGDINWVTCALASGRLDHGGREQFEQKLARYGQQLEQARKEGPARRWKRWPPMSFKGVAKEPWPGTLVVLIDRGCASSCESFLMFARQLPRVILMGENSAGVGEIGETRPYRLPNSGVWLQAGKKWFEPPRPGLAAPEGTGFLPDLWLSGPDWAAQVETLTNCLSDPVCERGLEAVMKR